MIPTGMIIEVNQLNIEKYLKNKFNKYYQIKSYSTNLRDKVKNGKIIRFFFFNINIKINKKNSMNTLDHQFSNFGGDTKERMSELDRRINAGILHRKEIVDMLNDVKGKTEKKLDEFKNKFNSFQDPNNLNVKEVKDLAKFSVGSFANIKDLEGGKIYRTEMVDKIEDFLNGKIKEGKITPENASKIVVAGMEELQYRGGSIEKTLFDAMRMVSGGKLLKIGERKKIEKKMQEGQNNIDLKLDKNNKGLIKIGDEEYTFERVEVLTGAAMVDFTPQMSSEFILQNAVIIDNQIWARMQNGCEGNLVIITDPIPVVPPVTPPQTPPQTPPHVDQTNIDDAGDYHMSVETRPQSRFTMQKYESYDEKLKPDLDPQILMQNFDEAAQKGLDAGVTALVDAIERLTTEEKKNVLGAFFAKLGSKSPDIAAQTAKKLGEILHENIEKYTNDMINLYDKKIKEADDNGNVDEKKLWETQKALIEIKNGTNKDPDALRSIQKNIKNMDKSKLTSKGTKEMYESIRKGTEEALRQYIALDMIKMSQNVLDQSLIKTDKLEKLMKKGKPAVIESLKSGIDSDEDIYIAVEQVNMALFYLVQVKYSFDIQSVKKIDNPIAYYMGELVSNNGNLNNIIAPVIKANPGIPAPSMDFYDFNEELRLFNEYQEGDETIGETQIMDVVGLGGKLRKSFMEREKGLIKGSEKIFKADELTEDNEKGAINEVGKLGAAERLQLSKLSEMVLQKHFDEARRLALTILGDKLDKPTNFDDLVKQEIKELKPKYETKIFAQTMLNLENIDMEGTNFTSKPTSILSSQSIGVPVKLTDVSKARRVLIENKIPANILKDDGKFFNSDTEYAAHMTNKTIEEMARLNVESENAKNYDLKADPKNLSQYQKLALNLLQKVEGKEWWRPSQENVEWVRGINNMLAEVVAIETGLGAFGFAATGASRAVRFPELFANTVKGGRLLGGQKYAAEFFNFGRGLASAGVPNRLANFATSGSLPSMISQSFFHGIAYSEAAAMLHGEFITDPSQLAAAGLNFVAMNGVLRVLRGAPGANVGIGRLTNRIAGSGNLGLVAMNAVDAAAMFGAIHYMGSAMERLQVGLGQLSQREVDAMREPEAWRRIGEELVLTMAFFPPRKAGKQLRLPPHEPQKQLPPHEPQKQLYPHEAQKELPPHETTGGEITQQGRGIETYPRPPIKPKELPPHEAQKELYPHETGVIKNPQGGNKPPTTPPPSEQGTGRRKPPTGPEEGILNPPDNGGNPPLQPQVSTERVGRRDKLPKFRNDKKIKVRHKGEEMGVLGKNKDFITELNPKDLKAIISKAGVYDVEIAGKKFKIYSGGDGVTIREVLKDGRTGERLCNNMSPKDLVEKIFNI